MADERVICPRCNKPSGRLHMFKIRGKEVCGSCFRELTKGNTKNIE